MTAALPIHDCCFVYMTAALPMRMTAALPMRDCCFANACLSFPESTSLCHVGQDVGTASCFVSRLLSWVTLVTIVACGSDKTHEKQMWHWCSLRSGSNLAIMLHSVLYTIM